MTRQYDFNHKWGKR